MHLQCLLLLWVPPLPFVRAIDTPIKGYKVVLPEWEVKMTLVNTTVLQGTIEEVLAKLPQMNPNWDEEYINSTRKTTDHEKRDSNMHIFDQNGFKRAKYECNEHWPECEPTLIATSIDYLRTIQGKPMNGPGPGTCGRDTSSKTLDVFGVIADGAEFIGKMCTRWGWELGRYRPFLSGQVFHDDKWNVIVQKEEC
ncbi:hypothetical protein EDB82DRAFT_469818 [Fusarium venenatum]|uniref:uncharacterized protein n=1 Tax=Fusarium venenatum TaxID=56646 RepID=UPI001E0BCD2A|nr:hypothetical protein EDB82DRAFT_469818 [Fusarium venenatum]